MNNELTGANLGSELNLCSENPGRKTLVVMPDMETAGELFLDLKNSLSGRQIEIRFSAMCLLFKNGSYIRIVTNKYYTDAIIEKGHHNCVLFHPSLIEVEPDIADLDNFLKSIL